MGKRFLDFTPLAAMALAMACGGSAKRAAPGGAPGVPVEVRVLEAKPVEQTTEFVGMVRSRRSATVQPQAEGFITRILVHPGERVAPGAALMEIDVRMQEASVASLESQSAARRAEVEYARQQATRMQTLLEGGAASQAELEQAQTALSTSQAQLQAIEAQIREQNVALAFHSVSAPVAGIVGDVPVRVGDSVTRASVLTTIDQNAGLEVYINVPVQEATRLKLGLPVHVFDDRGELLGDETLSFVSAAVDPATQSVLAKAVLHATKNVRTEQFVHAQIVWTKEPALLAPLVALDRINGQFFAYVAEKADTGGLVARQRAVELGAMIGNDYIVKSGLKAGETLIVSGVQKIREGAPVAPSASAK